MLFTGVAGYFSDKVIFKKLRENNSSNTVLLIASLGLATVIQSLLAIFFSNQFQTLSSNNGVYKTYTLFGGIITETQVLILLCLLLVIIFIAFLNRSFLGKKIEAISDSEEVSKIIGINTDKIISYTFFMGSVIAGMACVLIGMDTGINPNMGTDFLLKGVTASIIGGVGNLYGGIVGGLLIGLIENFSVWQFSGEWKDAITFIVLITFLLFRPNGIFKK
jgi:branched-chain amino acid transport system permease protein